jgi:hypothetical protein
MVDMDTKIANVYRNLCVLVQHSFALEDPKGLVGWRETVVGRALGNILLCDAAVYKKGLVHSNQCMMLTCLEQLISHAFFPRNTFRPFKRTSTYE